MAHLHDSGYKYLFSRRTGARAAGNLRPAGRPSCSTTPLRLESGNYVTLAMKPRCRRSLSGRLSCRGRRIYLYLLLEFQSTPDDTMPMRMLQYVAALYDHLLRSKAVDIADGLPPVLPIVLYNGDARWRQSSELYSLIRPHPPVLKPFQPQLKFWLLDERPFPPAELEDMQRVMAAIFVLSTRRILRRPNGRFAVWRTPLRNPVQTAPRPGIGALGKIPAEKQNAGLATP